MSLTTVFGMGTGGPSLQSTPTHETLYLVNARDILTEHNTKCKCFFQFFSLFTFFTKNLIFIFILSEFSTMFSLKPYKKSRVFTLPLTFYSNAFAKSSTTHSLPRLWSISIYITVWLSINARFFV